MAVSVTGFMTKDGKFFDQEADAIYDEAHGLLEAAIDKSVAFQDRPQAVMSFITNYRETIEVFYRAMDAVTDANNKRIDAMRADAEEVIEDEQLEEITDTKKEDANSSDRSGSGRLGTDNDTTEVSDVSQPKE